MKDLQYFTFPLNHDAGTITYLVDRIIQTENGIVALLKHPLGKNILLPHAAESIDAMISSQTQTMGKSNQQRWVEYIVGFTKKCEQIDLDTKREAEAYGLLFMINKGLTAREKDRLAKISGKVAKIHFNSDIHLALRFTKENVGLLDSYNKGWYYEKLKKGDFIYATHNAEVIFNIAGFALSQQDDFSGGLE